MSRPMPIALAASAAALLAVLAGCTAARAPQAPSPAADAVPRSPAVAYLFTASGQPGGRAELIETPAGVEIAITVQGIRPGLHGFHIHANGVCAPGPDPATGETVAFGAAGGHFDPGQSRKHGRPGQPAHLAHAGELPNIEVGPQGTGTLRYVNPNVTLSASDRSAFGRALVVHDQPDDYNSDPAGNSGPRVLCGVIQPAQAGPVIGRAAIGGAPAPA